ncbi:hypothetical protein BX265_6872 [Streptomyces sp. TLI_235]|nr:hypothetical protein [Streptomyces sp. TLI_235]PBC69543.1 hypothetical protein BX265_6872 [Streptomyces sp. TLI_235]
MGNGRTFGTDSGVGSTRALIEARLPAVRKHRQKLEDELAAVIAQENAMVSVLEGLVALSDAPLGEEGKAHGATPVRRTDQPPVADVHEGEVKTETTAATRAPVSVSATKAKAKRASPRNAAAVKTAGKRAAGRTAAAGVPASDRAQAPNTAAKKTAPRRSTKTAGTIAAQGKTAPKTAPRKEASPAARKPARVKTATATPDRTAVEPPRGRRRLTDANSVLAVLRQSEQPLRAREVTDRLGLDGVSGALDAVRTMLERLAKTSRAQRTGRGLYAAAD